MTKPSKNFMVQPTHGTNPPANGLPRIANAWNRRLLSTLLSTLILGAVGACSSLTASALACSNEAFRTGPSANLPDCRAYEEVSPVAKGDSGAVDPDATSHAEASPGGERIAYESYEAFPGAAGSTTFSEHLSTLGSSGWETDELTPAKTEPEPGADYAVNYPVFSANLSEVVIYAPDQLLTPEATPGVENLFLRRSNGSYTWINAGKPAFEAPPECECFEADELNEVTYEGASSNFEHIVFRSNAAYTDAETEPPTEYTDISDDGYTLLVNEIYSIYENLGGTLHLVNYLPNGGLKNANVGSGKSKRLEHAVSSEGTRIVFDAASNDGEPAEAGQRGDTEVYDRLNGDETIELSAPTGAPASSTAEASEYWAASANGSRVFFTSAQELTTDSTATAGAPDLYEYEFVSPVATSGTLTDLTVDHDAGEEADVLGVIGASENGEYVYFVAKGDLATGAKSGTPNLYMVHDDGVPVFIASLNETSDERDWAAKGSELEAYVTPDGQHVAFMSVDSLPTTNFPGGYDNVDQSTGSADSEVYEYSAPTPAEEITGETGKLACGSCDPREAQPNGGALIAGVNATSPEQGASTPFHQARALSESGARLFFTSPPITSENGPAAESSPEKLYEYEEDGEGGEDGCHNVDGCVFMISSPTNSSNDYFLDASSSGDDVFFSTESQLSPIDGDHFRDVYDARVEGGQAAHAAEHPCESGCRPVGATVATGPSLLSTTIGTPDNFEAPAKAKPKKKPKPTKKASQSKADKLAKALKKCRSERSKSKRRSCEARARKRYGAKSKKAKVKTKKTSKAIQGGRS